MLIPILACRAADQTNRRLFTTYKVASTPTTTPSPTPASLALVLACTLLALSNLQITVSYELTPVASKATYYNYSKDGYKSFTCLEPRQLGTVYEIEEEEELDSMDKELGKEDP